MKFWIRQQLLRIKLYISENFANEAESLVIWYAVVFALGSAIYLTLPFEISAIIAISVLEINLLLLYLYRKKYVLFKFLTYTLVMILSLCIAKADAMYRAKKIEKNVAEFSYLRGKIKDIDYNYAHKPRILLTDVENFDKPLLGDFRISTNIIDDNLYQKGKCIELVAQFPKKTSLNPLSHYNYERSLFYKGISKTGYSISPIFTIDCQKQDSNLSITIERWRENIKKIIDKNTSLSSASIIKAIAIGDKTGLTQKQNHNYRTAGLAHFFAISGMHMGMIALLVFFLIRSLFFFIGQGRYDLRKPAAIISMITTFMYFLISGQSVSCIRAFIMTMLLLLAILINRRAISQRMWAFAMIVVVMITPSATITPGFLMSFMAVLGLISYYETYGTRLSNWFNHQKIMGKVGIYFLGVIVTDLIASLMTLPYSIYYFNQIAIYTTIGNFLAAIIITFWIMPALLLFFISLIFNGEVLSLKILSGGINTLSSITDYVANLPNADMGEGISGLTSWGVFMITIGILWLCIWQQHWRRLGVIFIIIGLLSMLFIPQADFVFDSKGVTYAYRNNKGKLVASPYHKNRFLIKMWTGNDSKTATENDDIICNKQSCKYKERIEFGKEIILYDNIPVSLKNGGYIDLKRGIYHSVKEENRLWNN